VLALPLCKATAKPAKAFFLDLGEPAAAAIRLEDVARLPQTLVPRALAVMRCYTMEHTIFFLQFSNWSNN